MRERFRPCVATAEEEGSYALRLRLPNGGKEKHLLIPRVRFAYGQEEFEDALACGRALCYRFLRDEKGWRVFVSMEAAPVKPISERRLGAIGIDMNPDQLVVAEVDRSGNFTRGEAIPCITYGKTQERAKDILGNAAKQAVEAAVRVGKPIVIERLDFKDKKAALENEGSKRARMLSSFAYKQTMQCLNLKAAAFRAGVEVIEINPAYTSTIGSVNFAARYGVSVHQGAAIAVARRGLGLSERPATRVAQVPSRDGDHLTLQESESACMVVLVGCVATDSSGACSAYSVASCKSGQHTWTFVLPGPVCNLTIAGETPARESFPEPFGKRTVAWLKMPWV